MTDQERISLILAEMERNAILRAAKSKLLMDAVTKIALARVQVDEGEVAERLAEDEIVNLQAELELLEVENQRNVSALRNLQTLIALTEQYSVPVVSEPVVEDEVVEEVIPVEPTEG